MEKYGAFIKNVPYLNAIYNYNPASQYNLFCTKTGATFALARIHMYGSDAVYLTTVRIHFTGPVH
jgi:hypothetical protein